MSGKGKTKPRSYRLPEEALAKIQKIVSESNGVKTATDVVIAAVLAYKAESGK